MKLYNKKNAAVRELQMETATPQAQISEFDMEMGKLETKGKEILIQIGQTFLKENTAESCKDTPYESFLTELEEVEQSKKQLEERHLAIQGLRKCSDCGNILSHDSQFCNKCGAKLEQLSVLKEMPQNICKQCGTQYKQGMLFCPFCGSKVAME